MEDGDVPEKASRERGSCPKGTEHGSKTVKNSISLRLREVQKIITEKERR